MKTTLRIASIEIDVQVNMKEVKPPPLSEHAKGKLREMLDAPLPVSTINPGVRHKLCQQGLATIVQRRSPFAVHKGGMCDHLTLTDAGREMATILNL